VLNSIPGVLLIAAAVLIVQVYIESNPGCSTPPRPAPTSVCWRCVSSWA